MSCPAKYRRGRALRAAGLVVACALVVTTACTASPTGPIDPADRADSAASAGADTSTVMSAHPPGSVVAALAALPVKGRAPKTGYTRAQFGRAWANVDHVGCGTVRDRILARDLSQVTYRAGGRCTVLSGTLHDPYTGRTIAFVRGRTTSAAVQIDHVAALGDVWQTGAQRLTPTERERLANDALELLAVDGPTNEKKGDADAASWLPPFKASRCGYVARQVAVKTRYRLWITPVEHDAIARVLTACPNQALPSR